MYLQIKEKMLLFLLVHFFLSFFNIVSKDLRLSLSGVIFVRAEKKIGSFICFRG